MAKALKDDRWRKAKGLEIDAEIQNGTWDTVPMVPSYNVVGCKWVFTIKCFDDGSTNRFKACLVEKRFHQQPGIDFHETFILVIKQATIRPVLGVVVSRDWPLR